MTLFDIEVKLRKKFLYRKCRIVGSHGGSETTHRTGKPVTRIIAGQEFKKVIDIEVSGQPSAWYWQANFVFDDDTISASFVRMSDVEIEK